MKTYTIVLTLPLKINVKVFRTKNAKLNEIKSDINRWMNPYFNRQKNAFLNRLPERTHHMPNP